MYHNLPNLPLHLANSTMDFGSQSALSIDAILNDPIARKQLEKRLKETSPGGFRVRATISLEEVVKQFRVLSKSTFKTLMDKAYDNVHRDDIPKPLPAYQQFVKATFPIIREDNPGMHASEALQVISVMWADFNDWADNTPVSSASKSASATSSDNSKEDSGDSEEISDDSASKDIDDFLQLASELPLEADFQPAEESVDLVCASVSCKRGFTLVDAGLTEMPANSRRWYCQSCVDTNPRIGRTIRRRYN